MDNEFNLTVGNLCRAFRHCFWLNVSHYETDEIYYQGGCFGLTDDIKKMNVEYLSKVGDKIYVYVSESID